MGCCCNKRNTEEEQDEEPVTPPKKQSTKKSRDQDSAEANDKAKPEDTKLTLSPNRAKVAPDRTPATSPKYSDAQDGQLRTIKDNSAQWSTEAGKRESSGLSPFDSSKKPSFQKQEKQGIANNNPKNQSAEKQGDPTSPKTQSGENQVKAGNPLPGSPKGHSGSKDETPKHEQEQTKKGSGEGTHPPPSTGGQLHSKSDHQPVANAPEICRHRVPYNVSDPPPGFSKGGSPAASGKTSVDDKTKAEKPTEPSGKQEPDASSPKGTSPATSGKTSVDGKTKPQKSTEQPEKQDQGVSSPKGASPATSAKASVNEHPKRDSKDPNQVKEGPRTSSSPNSATPRGTSPATTAKTSIEENPKPSKEAKTSKEEQPLTSEAKGSLAKPEVQVHGSDKRKSDTDKH